MWVATANMENPAVKGVVIVTLLLALLTIFGIALVGPKTTPEEARRRKALEERWEAEARQEEEERKARAEQEEEEREATARRAEARAAQKEAALKQAMARAKQEQERQRERRREEQRKTDELWANPRLREEIREQYLRWLLSGGGSAPMRFRGAKLPRTAMNRVHTWAVREGYAVDDGRGRRLTDRGKRIFEEYGGDRKRMSDAEKKRHQPSIKIDARGAGTVAHTINGGVRNTTVNNAAPGAQASGEVDLAAALELIAQLRRALSGAHDLPQWTRERAAADLGVVDAELRAPDEQREPERIRSALEKLRTTFVGVDGLVQVVNQLWGHVHVWFSS